MLTPRRSTRPTRRWWWSAGIRRVSRNPHRELDTGIANELLDGGALGDAGEVDDLDGGIGQFDGDDAAVGGEVDVRPGSGLARAGDGQVTHADKVDARVPNRVRRLLVLC